MQRSPAKHPFNPDLHLATHSLGFTLCACYRGCYPIAPQSLLKAAYSEIPVALLLKSLRCPHCNEAIDKPLLKRKGLLKSFLERKPFACPHCEAPVVFPEKSETIVSSGIFVAVILAPLFHLWDVAFIDSKHLLALGAAILVVGLAMQKLDKASPDNDK